MADLRDSVAEGLRRCVDKAGSCAPCPYFPMERCDEHLLTDALALIAQAAPPAEHAPEPAPARLIRPEEYDTWAEDAWCERQDTGEISAIDRSAVAAYIRYINFDTDTRHRLWTALPTEAQRRDEPWPT